MQKITLVLGFVLSAIGSIAHANNVSEAQPFDNTSKPMQAYCVHWSAARGNGPRAS